MTQEPQKIGCDERARRTLPPCYVDLAFLGAGGSGQVFRARDSRSGRCVAIKVLAPALSPSQSDEIQRRFEREALALQRLHHFSIVEILEVSAGGEVPYLVMEYVEGPTLGDLLRPARPLAIKVALELALAIAEGLAHAHSRGIIHRDVKPDNVILPKGGGVKILDFGLARVAGATAITGEGVLLGTLPYMAPEQLHAGAVTPATDIYALGAILYQMITGRLPLGPEEVWSRVRRTPDPPSTHNPLVSPRLDAVVMECLAVQPASRFQTAQELAGPLALCRDEVAAGVAAGTGAGAGAGEGAGPGEAQRSGWDALEGADLEKLSWAFPGRESPGLVLVDAELRELAVLRVVLEGLPSEDGQRRVVRQQCFRALARCVESRGGCVDCYDDAGLRAVFGGREGSGDHTHTAMLAAVRLRERIEILNRLLGEGSLRGRIAVDLERRATGPGADTEPRASSTLLDSLDSSAAALDPTPAPPAPPAPGSVPDTDLPSRPASILASPEVCRRLRTGWTFEPYADRRNRVSFALVAEPPPFAPRCVEGLGTAPFVGREDALALLGAFRDRYRKRAGEDASVTPALMLLSGDAGAGKTRLASALLASGASGAAVWRSAAAPGLSVPYAPIVSALRTLAGLTAQTPAAVCAKSLGAWTGQARLEADPAMAWALSFLMGAASGPQPRTFHDPQQLRRKIQDAVVEVLRGAAAAQIAAGRPPATLVIEDLQWADAHTIDLLDRLLAQPGLPLLVLADHRTGFAPPARWAEGEPRCMHALSPLDDDQMIVLATHLLRGPPAAELASVLTHRAMGNPYYLEELIGLWMAQGRLHHQSGTWTLVGKPPGGIPAPIESILLARMDLMDREARQVVQMTAVLGEECEPALLTAMCAHIAPRVERLAESLDRLVGEGILERRGASRLQFRHALLRDAVYRSLLAVNRRSLHMAAGLALEEESRGAYAADPRVVARHFLRAGDKARACVWARPALEAAGLGYDHAGLLAIAQDLLDLLGDAPDTRTDVFHVLAQRERVLEITGQRVGQEQDLRRMMALALAMGDQSRLADAQNRLSWFHWWNRADYFKAKELALSAMALKRRLGESRGEAAALRNLGSIHYYLGNFRESVGYHRRALQLYRQCQDAEGEAASLCSMGINALRLFHFARALQVCHEALVIDRGQCDRRGEGRDLRTIGDVLREVGSLEEAAEHYRAALANDREIGYVQGIVMNLGGLAAVAAGRDALDEARDLSIEALERAKTIGATQAVVLGHIDLADVLRRRAHGHDLEDALIHARKAIELASSAGLHGLLVRALAQEGIALAVSGRPMDGVAKTAAAVALSGPGPHADFCPYQVLWAHHLVLAAAGRGEEARQALASARQALLAQSKQIDAKALARSYLEDVALHRQILGLSGTPPAAAPAAGPAAAPAGARESAAGAADTPGEPGEPGESAEPGASGRSGASGDPGEPESPGESAEPGKSCEPDPPSVAGEVDE